MRKIEHLITAAFIEGGEKEYREFISADTSEVVVLGRVDRWIRRDIARSLKKERTAKIRHVALRVAFAVMLILSLMFVSLMCFAKTREAIFNAIIEWRDNYIAIHYDGNNNADSSEMSSEETPTIPAPPTIIEEERKPIYIPEGIIEIPIFSNQSGVLIEYYNASDEMVYAFNQYVLTEEDQNFDNEGATLKEISKAGFFGTFISYANVEEKHFMWNDAEYLYIIRSYALDEDDVIKIAMSVESGK